MADPDIETRVIEGSNGDVLVESRVLLPDVRWYCTSDYMTHTSHKPEVVKAAKEWQREDCLRALKESLA